MTQLHSPSTKDKHYTNAFMSPLSRGLGRSREEKRYSTSSKLFLLHHFLPLTTFQPHFLHFLNGTKALSHSVFPIWYFSALNLLPYTF